MTQFDHVVCYLWREGIEPVFPEVLVPSQQNYWSNFGAKARIIDERKLMRIALIRINLRSLRSIDSTQLSH